MSVEEETEVDIPNPHLEPNTTPQAGSSTQGCNNDSITQLLNQPEEKLMANPILENDEKICARPNEEHAIARR